MATKALQRYIDIRNQINDLERELEELKESVFKEVEKNGGQVEQDSCVIRSYKQPKYKFSENYEAKNSELKELRKTEIDKGIAQIDGYSEFVKVRFKSSSD